MVSWLDMEGDKAMIKAAKISTEGKMIQQYTIVETSPSRKSGFPQMERLGDHIYWAWTALGEDASTIKTAIIKI